jgi:TATA-box binding protein (TBP) (component of TFIID and TFIIIB)
MNISNTNSKKWQSYQFEVEKYMEQMVNNPYLNELEDQLYDQKYKKIRDLMGEEILAVLTFDLINDIFNNFNSDKKLQILKKNIENNFHLKNKDNKDNIFNIIKFTIEETKKELINLNIDVVLKPTELRISTMTACMDIGICVDTKYLYEKYCPPNNITLSEYTSNNKVKYNPELDYSVVGCKAENYPTKGFFVKKKKSNFFNSAALNVLLTNNKTVNVKVFNNGKLQMTGVPNEEGGNKAAEIVIELIKSIADDVQSGKKIVFDKKRLEINNYRTVLINSDYYCGMEIKREHLFLILQDEYDLSVSYESENYPGVKLEYFWNKNTLNTPNEGKCECSKKCTGKGMGNGDLDCKKVTVSSFQSGKVIVTGARSREQINNAYKFINAVFQNNYQIIRKKNTSNKTQIKKNIQSGNNNQIFFLKKNLIQNYTIYQSLIKGV